MSNKQLIVIPELYHAPPSLILSTIQQCEDHYNTIALVCHNPGITLFANMIAGLSIDNVPTCGVLAFKTKVKEWKEVLIENMMFDFFDYPKNVS